LNEVDDVSLLNPNLEQTSGIMFYFFLFEHSHHKKLGFERREKRTLRYDEPH